MYFVRTFHGGGGPHDPRRKLWAEFQCDNCNNLAEIDITTNNTFDFDRERVCPKCKTLGLNDAKKSLERERERLIRQRSLIDEKINEISFKLKVIDNKNVKKEILEISK
jgi:hypothetical protein